jgi:hypothetical protein
VTDKQQTAALGARLDQEWASLNESLLQMSTAMVADLLDRLRPELELRSLNRAERRLVAGLAGLAMSRSVLMISERICEEDER